MEELTHRVDVRVVPSSIVAPVPPYGAGARPPKNT